MSDTKLNASVTNATGDTINVYWIKHKPHDSSSHADWGYGTNLAVGDSGATFGIELESNESDVWTVVWTNEKNTLYTTSYDFKALALSKGGDVEIKIEDSEVEIRQDGNKLGTNSNTQYGAGYSTSPSS